MMHRELDKTTPTDGIFFIELNEFISKMLFLQVTTDTKKKRLKDINTEQGKTEQE